jgi:hypothetical protein
MTTRRRVVVALIGLGLGAAVVVRVITPPDGPPASAAAPARGTVLWVAPDGDDDTCARTQRSRPCASLNRAYELARCGERVEIEPGIYRAPQDIAVDESKGSCKNYVYFRSRGRARFTGDWTWGGAWISVRHVAVDRAAIEFASTAGHARLVDSEVYQWSTRGTDEVILSGNIFNGRFAVANNEVMPSRTDETDGTTDLTITENTFTGYDPVRIPDNHSEAIFVGGWTNGVLIEGNTFTNNGTTGHLFFTWWGGDANDPASYPRNICVRGNHFDLSRNGYFDIQFRQELTGAENIDVEPRPSNTLGRSLKEFRTKLLGTFSPRRCSPYPPF